MGLLSRRLLVCLSYLMRSGDGSEYLRLEGSLRELAKYRGSGLYAFSRWEEEVEEDEDE